MFKKTPTIIELDGFTYHFVKLGLVALGIILLFEAGRFLGAFMKDFLS